MAKDIKGADASLRNLDRFGTFGTPAYTSIGDPYNPKNTLDSRYKGKQFVTNPLKKGRTKDATLERDFKPLFVGDRYVDSSSFERQARAESRKKMISAKPWVPSNPPKKATGGGSMYGTLAPPPEHKPDPPKPPQRKPADQVGKRGFVPASPPKRGSYGTPGVLISHKEYEHKPEPYEKREFKKPAGTPAVPFKSMSKTGLVFDRNAVFSMDPKVIVSKSAKPPPAAEKKPAVPFRPSSPAKSGKQGAFTPFPEYRPTPYVEKAVKKTEPTKVFKPSSASCKSGPTRSILVSSLAASLHAAH